MNTFDESFSDTCEHYDQILDQHEGSIVCLICAKVLDFLFEEAEVSFSILLFLINMVPKYRLNVHVGVGR